MSIIIAIISHSQTMGNPHIAVKIDQKMVRFSENFWK